MPESARSFEEDEASGADEMGKVRYGGSSCSEWAEDASRANGRVSVGVGDGHGDGRGEDASKRSLAAEGPAPFSERWDSGEYGWGSGWAVYSVSMGMEPNQVQMELSGRLEDSERDISRQGRNGWQWSQQDALARADGTSGRTYRRICVA